jgi:hypothetical protein
VEAADVEAGLSALLGGLRQAINNLPGRLADKMLDITDHHEGEELTQEEMNVLLKTLDKFKFLDGIKVPQLNFFARPSLPSYLLPPSATRWSGLGE